MTTYDKGENSRKEIIRRSRQIFNDYGIQITLAKLAELMDTTLGRITYHFKNKDLLFLAIAEEYEQKLTELRGNRSSGPATMDNFIKSSSKVFDLQYEYRCAMRFIIASMQNPMELQSHIHVTYSKNRVIIRNTIQNLIDSGLVQDRILQDDVYEVFLFQFTNLFTNWVINRELYDYDKPFQELKPIYMKGIISVFLPYLTRKGTDELYHNALFKG